MRWTRVVSLLRYPLSCVPVTLSLQYATSVALAAGCEQMLSSSYGAPPAAAIATASADADIRERFGRGRLPRIDDELLELEWGDLQVLHTTDIHGWYQGHPKLSPPEPNYSGDWGDWIAFTHHMRKRAAERGADLLLVDTGDLHDGNGLSDAFPELDVSHPNHRHAVNGHVSNQVFALADYDLLTIGNHELYNFSVAQDVYENFAPRWHGRYLTSNVNISLPDSSGALRSRPIGARYTRFETPQRKLRIQAYGFLFDFRLAAAGVHVQSPAEAVREPWFQESLHAGPVDAFVIAGHMPVTGDAGWQALLRAIRSVHPTTPVLMLGGHTHVRDCRVPDAYAMALESGRYLETVGWMSVSGVRRGGGEEKPRFSRRYIDTNPRNFAFHAGLKHAGELSTPEGRFARSAMDAVAEAWNLTQLFGLVPSDYYLERVPYGHPQSLITLLRDRVLPEIVRPAEPSRAHRPSVILVNSGSQRFDVYAGPFSKNDQYVVSPFRDDFLYLADVPWRLARRLVHGLNEEGEDESKVPGGEDPEGGHPAGGAAEHVLQRSLARQWADYWAQRLRESGLLGPSPSRAAPAPMLSGRPEQARRLEELLLQLRTHPESVETPHSALAPLRDAHPASLGYVTIDECPGQGDDTRHTPVPYSAEQQDYVASDPVPEPAEEERVDVVMVDFILKRVLRLLNMWDTQRRYTAADAKVWGNVSTQWLYPLFVEHAWHPKDMAAAWAKLDRGASLQGYPPLPHFDEYTGDPYEAVRLAQQAAAVHGAPLHFQ